MMSPSEQATRKYSCKNRSDRPPRRRVVRIEHPRERLGDGLVEYRAEELAAGEFAEIEEVGRRRGPEP